MKYVSFLDRTLATGNIYVSYFSYFLFGFICLFLGGTWLWLGGLLIFLGCTASLQRNIFSLKKHRIWSQKEERVHLVDLQGNIASKKQKIYHATISSLPVLLILLSFVTYLLSDVYQENLEKYTLCKNELGEGAFSLGFCLSYLGLGNVVFITIICVAYLLHLLCFLAIIFTKEKTSLYDLISKVRLVYISNDDYPSKTKIKRVGLFLSYISSLLCITFIAYHIPDKELNSNVDTFFYDDPFKTENNVYVSWAGLTAPQGEKNTYKYGLKVWDHKVEEVDPLKFKGETYNFCGSYDEILEKVECASSQVIREYFKENKELIDRYVGLYQYENHGVGNSLGKGSGQTLISIHKLLTVYWLEMTKKGEGEEAIQGWIEDTLFLQKMLGGKGSLIENAIFMVMYSSNLKILPLLLDEEKILIFSYKDKIKNLLDKSFLHDIWNIEETLRAEYNVMRMVGLDDMPNSLFLKPNATKNKFFEFAQDMLLLSHEHPQNLKKALNLIEKRYEDYSKPTSNFGYNLIGRLLFSGFLKGGELLQNGHEMTARQRILILWMNAKEQKISPENMPDFLSSSSESLYNPFTEKPFSWNPETSYIYFIRDESLPDVQTGFHYRMHE